MLLLLVVVFLSNQIPFFLKLFSKKKMNPRNRQRARNPYIPREYGSSSSLPTYAGSPSNQSYYIPSFSKTQIDSSTSNPSMASISRRNPRLEQTITDPVTDDTYLLNSEIGSFSNGSGRVFRALYSKSSPETAILSQSGVVTLKILDMDRYESESRELWIQGQTGITDIPYGNIIGSKRIFSDEHFLYVSLPYMSEGSLRSILSARPKKKLPEDFISVILKEVLIGLRDELHVEFNPKVHKTLNAGDIFVNIDEATQEMSIKLAFEASVYDSEIPNQEATPNSLFLNPKNISTWGAAPEVFGSEKQSNNSSGPKSDIWLLGITAMELAYGNLPVKNRRDLDYIVKKIREKNKLPKSLKKMMNKRDGKFKNLVKQKKRAFSEEFEEIVLACLRESPENRPTAGQLLNTPFFTSADERLKKFMLNGKN
ncbi:serine/threonine-protein kinase BLUS1-like [Solanum dulcamara]|uniref:serine/threonine-protein kinase BLUS1-like n=1 Tax=Solanum dulcamara TaxID=45834 RepID=UPI00248510E6|nr:serine/threonine-protein kinase BLUS1-like [Solanum dulcamara]